MATELKTQFLDIVFRDPSDKRGYFVNYAYKIYSPLKPHPIVLIAGWGQCKENWYDFVNILCKTRMVIVFDHRGIGESKIIFDPYNLDESYNAHNIPSFTLSDLADDIACLIQHIFDRKELMKTKIDILGLSMGGMFNICYIRSVDMDIL